MLYRRINHVALLLNLLQVVIDACACLGGFAFAFWLYKDTRLLESLKAQEHVPHSEHYYFVAAAFTAIVLLSFAVKHLYQSRETGLMNMDEAVAVMQGLFFSFAVVITGTFFLPKTSTAPMSRLILGLGAFLGSVLLMAGRVLGYKLRRYLQARGHFFRRVIICGAGEAGRTIARKLLHSPKFHIRPVAFLDDDKAKQNTEVECLTGHQPIPVAGRVHQLDEAIQKYDAHEVWIAITRADQNTIIDIALAAGERGVPCRFVPNLYQIPLQSLTVETLGGVPLLSIKPRATVQKMPV
ncbi:MAG: hypothetical protein ABSE73_33460, partial [Planctomycetota bacterium]